MKKETIRRIQKHLAEARRELNIVQEGWFGLGKKKRDEYEDYEEPVYADEAEEMAAIAARWPRECANIDRKLRDREGDDQRQQQWVRDNVPSYNSTYRYAKLWLLVNS